MADASTESPLNNELSDNNSQNGAAGPPSSIDNSLEDEVSIHLSPKGPRKDPSPKATKASAARAKQQQLQHQQKQQGRTGLAMKPSLIKRSSTIKGQGQIKMADLQSLDTCGMCDEQHVMKARLV